MQYHLALSSDANYIPYLFVVCQSIVDHLEIKSSNQQDELVFNVLVDESIDISIASLSAECFVVKNQECTVNLSFKWHMVSVDNFSHLTSMIRDGQTSFSTYYRLIIDRLLPDNVQYIVYLDIDMLVLTDIRKLFDQNDISGKLLGAVVDLGITDRISNKEPFIYLSYKHNSDSPIKLPKKSYFNAGLLLINLNEWRRINLSETSLKLAAQLNLPFHDQDLLNYVCLGKVEFLDLSWNFQTNLFYTLYNKVTGKYDIANAIVQDQHLQSILPPAEKFEGFLRKPNIIHFLSAKPWNTVWQNCDPPYVGTVRACPQVIHYRDQWLETERRALEHPNTHVINVDSISFREMETYSLRCKAQRHRNLIYRGLIALLTLNLVVLACILLKDS